ncbi:basement membrane-specific heparan sulfate proteoglycan core protein-like isoform X2 [Esox lucius]|uniref:Ig-like domain-containing protein n=1 Tax=Esox lucius TaxID=8010 RepID=A0A6Q2ZBH3_ESOLU|nr:basement membrane-specific heparan sulfate proteoglycan core protein-like isoform X2 [Esox lucius]
MNHTWLCVLLLLNTLIYCGHSQGVPEASVNIVSPQEPLYTGERVILQCYIPEYTDWTYFWYRDNQLLSSQTRKTTTITLPDQAGQYQCRGKRTKWPESSFLSPNHPISATDRPKAVLSISHQWMNPGDSVTLNCEVKDKGWRFSWYKTVPYRAGLPSLLDKSYSVEPLSGYGTTEESYTLSPAGPTDTGGYVCRAGRGDPVYYTNYSEPQCLWSGDLQSSVSLRIGPNRTQHFTSKSLSLTCDLKGNSTGWRLMRYTETGVKSGCSPNWGSITGSTCTITSTYTGDSGVYWCESGSGQYSNAVNITVSGGDVILESPVHPVTEGDSVTLLCTHRNQPHTNPKADFYKDGVLISNETTGEMTIPTVSKSDEGFYKCKSDQIESPECWVTVRVPPGSLVSISLSRLLCGLPVVSPFLLVSILMVKYCRAGGLCSTTKSPEEKLQCDDEIKQTESSL